MYIIWLEALPMLSVLQLALRHFHTFRGVHYLCFTALPKSLTQQQSILMKGKVNFGGAPDF